MDRPYLVYVGGSEEQPIECLYLGTEGDLAQSIFEDAGSDGANEIVRFCTFPEHSQIRTPKRDGVPVREPSATMTDEGSSESSNSTAGAPPVIVPATTTAGTAQAPAAKGNEPPPAPGAGGAPQTPAVAGATGRKRTMPAGAEEAFDA